MLLETIEMCALRIDKEKLEAALSTLYDENSNSYFTGQFISLVQNSRSAAFWPTAAPSLTYNPHQVAKRILLIYTDLQNIATVSIRLIMQQLWRGNESKPRIGDELWRYFASADIDLFFSKYRSVFDNISQLIKTISRGSLSSSFHELMKKAKTGKLPLRVEYVELMRLV
jgi:hypothetical protein